MTKRVATHWSGNAADGETFTGLTAANACGSIAATHWSGNAADGETVTGLTAANACGSSAVTLAGVVVRKFAEFDAGGSFFGNPMLLR